jgi:hypothetical protein
MNDGISNRRSAANDYLHQIVFNQQLLHKLKKWCKVSSQVKAKSCKMKPCKMKPAAGLILPRIHKLKTTGGKIQNLKLLNPQTFCMEGRCLTLTQTGPPAVFLSSTINKLHYTVFSQI